MSGHQIVCFLFLFSFTLLSFLEVVPCFAITTTSDSSDLGEHDSSSSSANNDDNSEEQYEEGEDLRPNIILLLTDDQDILIGGVDHMPYLQQLMTERGSTVFENGFVHTPICCPSRMSILSGRYIHNLQVFNNSDNGNCYGKIWQEEAERETFAVFAQQHGYQTSYAGKYLNQYGLKTGSHTCYHNETYPGCNRTPPGWDKWLGLIGNSKYYNYSIVQSDDNGTTFQRMYHGSNYEFDYFPDVVTNRTLDIIEQFTSNEHSKRRRQPFLVVNAWPSPHAPWTPAPFAEHMFDNVKAHRTENWNASSVFMNKKHWIMRQLAPIDNETEYEIDSIYRGRIETLQSVDEHIRNIIDLLKRKHIFNNTIIMYTSDNGYQLGQHRIKSDKRYLYEHDIRVPFVVINGASSESIESATTNATNTQSHIVLNIDIAPTVYDIVTSGKRPLPENMDGMSFAHLIHPVVQKTSVDSSKENKDSAGSSTSSLASCCSQREDFLISYFGEGVEPCGTWDCPMPTEFHGGDSFNNTYHCIRTIRKPKQADNINNLIERGANDIILAENYNGDKDNDDSIYCRFIDDENFVEYYDLTIDPWQLNNRYSELSEKKRAYFELRLATLLNCNGESCRRSQSHSSFPVNIL